MPSEDTFWSKNGWCVSQLGHNWFRWWLVACSAPNHNPNQCWVFFFNWALKYRVKGFLTQPRGCLVQQMQLDMLTLKYRSRFSCLSVALLVWLYHTLSHQFPNTTQYPGDLLADSHFGVVHFCKIPHPDIHNSFSNYLPESGWRPLCHLVLVSDPRNDYSLHPVNSFSVWFHLSVVI